jgi:hypothetical protein
MRALASDSLVKNEPEQGYVMAEQNAYQIADWNGQTGERWVANQARPMEMEYAICNGFGFGGVNSSALFRRWTDNLADASAGGSRH